MGYTTYLKIDGIAGDCDEAGHRGWMLLDGFNQSIMGPQEGGGRQQNLDFGVSRMVSAASPQLARATAEGRHFKDVVIELCSTEGRKARLMEIRLTNAVLSNYCISGGSSPDQRAPYENFAFRYEAVDFRTFPEAFVPVREPEAVGACA